MSETQQQIKKNSNTSKKRVIQIQKRVGADNCFKSLDSFHNSLLLGKTRGETNPEIRELKMDAISKEKKYSYNMAARKLIVYALESGVTPEELFDL